MRLGKFPVIGILVVAAALVIVVVVSQNSRGPEPVQSGPDMSRRLERLRSLPYTTVTPEEVDPSEGGVVIHEKDRAGPGYNLYCSEVKPEAYLMNMSGEIVHGWSYPDMKPWHWRAVEMMENGDLLVINKQYALIKLDWDSNLIWSRKMQIHHDVTVAPDGSMFVLTTEARRHRGALVKFDAILHLDSLGNETSRWWSYDHLDEIELTFDRRSFLDGILDSLSADAQETSSSTNRPPADPASKKTASRIYDYFHLNTVNLLPPTPLSEEDPIFSPGNLLVCFRNVNQIAVLDRNTMEILWVWGEGELEWPHYPVMLASGNILVYDNGVVREYSRIIEVNPSTGKIEWQYTAEPPEAFYSETKGAAQRLPNGNTLICDSNSGRVFEVTREGETVWEWLNPATQDGHRVQVVRMYRLAPEEVDPLLEDRLQARTIP